MFLASCGTTLEGKGNSAFSRAKGATGDQKRLLEKEAYTWYWKAIKKFRDPTKIRNSLRNHFVEATVNRAKMMLDEGSSSMDALDLFVRDIDTILSNDVRPELKQSYAEFLSNMADSAYAHNKLIATLKWFDKAQRVAIDPAPFAAKKEGIVKSYVKEKVDAAKSDYDEGKTNKDGEALIRAEFNSRLALYFDPKNADALDILSKARKENIKVYSAYDMVIDEKPDTNVYRAINCLDILLSIGNVSGTSMRNVCMFNYSYNPLRLYTKDFYILDTKGNKYQALTSSKVEPEILEQQHETKKISLNFPKPAGEIAKLIYQCEGHYSEKCFL